MQPAQPAQHDPAGVIARHAVRRATGVPTVSALVGPVGVGSRVWRAWVGATGWWVAVTRATFPLTDWLAGVAEITHLPFLAVAALAVRGGRDPDQLSREWRTKTAADHEQFWNTLAPEPDDDVLRVLTSHAADGVTHDRVAAALTPFGERAVRSVVRLGPPGPWPGVLFVAGSVTEVSAVAAEATAWAVRAPVLPLAVAVPTAVWAEYLAAAPDSRAKAILREGEVPLRHLDPTAVVGQLAAVGVAADAAAVIAASGADAVPRWVVVMDEFADLMTDRATKPVLEPLLRRLGAKARAAGIHLILGTQRPSADVVTPLLRSNLPGRIGLQVASEKDSKLFLDEPDAAYLFGKGDLVWKRGGRLERLQSPFVPKAEFDRLLRVAGA